MPSFFSCPVPLMEGISKMPFISRYELNKAANAASYHYHRVYFTRTERIFSIVELAQTEKSAIDYQVFTIKFLSNKVK